MHGGKSPGAPSDEAHHAYKSGRFTYEAVAQWCEFRALMRAATALAGRV